MIKIGGHRVLVKPVLMEEIDDAFASAKRAGIELLKSEKDVQQNAVDRGDIIQVGSTAATDFNGDLWFAEGDKIMYSRYAGKKVKDPETDVEYLILNAEDVLCVLGSAE